MTYYQCPNCGGIHSAGKWVYQTCAVLNCDPIDMGIDLDDDEFDFYCPTCREKIWTVYLIKQEEEI